MKRLAVVVILALVAAACSSSSDTGSAAEPTTSTTSVDATSSSSSSTSAGSTTTTTTETVSTIVAAADDSDVSSCVVGDWEMDSQQFFDDIFAALPADEALGEFIYTSGAYVLLIGADGTFSSERREWTFQVASEEGDLEMMINGAETGTYTLVGNQLTTVSESSEPLEISMAIDGVPFDLPVGFAPVTPPNADFSGAIVTCEGDVLTASAEGFQSIWYRTG
ncbi:MAG: hypothetical protein ACC654_09375 [Acidimicrobiia bacterium]